jgi:hypothetical protein
MSKMYVLFFLLGFMIDKVRLFPFVLGLVVGLLIKALIDTRPAFNLDAWTLSAKEAYTQFQSLGTDTVS